MKKKYAKNVKEMFPKPKRVKNKKLLSEFRDKPCIVNDNCNGPVAGHHVRSKGSGGDDSEENLLALCFKHHREIHDKGNQWFLERYRIK